MAKILVFLLFLLPHTALGGTPTPAHSPIEQPFHFSTTLGENHTLLAHWHIAKHTYLYQDQFAFTVLSPKGIKILKVARPKAQWRKNALIGDYQVYTHQVTIPIQVSPPGKKQVRIQIDYQGCADDGYCYPPESHVITANFAQGHHLAQPQSPPQDKVANLLRHHHLPFILLSFLGFGLLLGLTPCVLPMIPILSGIILGQQKTLTTGKAFGLSLTYVLAMSLTYAAAGMAFGYLGGTLQARLQQPWVIVLFSLVFVAMALSLFGFYSLEPPRALATYLAKISRQQRGGHLIGALIMGVLATLIVSPCVTPALVGALAYIGQTGHAMVGGAALFALGFGMGLPLLVIGTAHGNLLPKAGPWMNEIKSLFGVLMLGLAVWLLGRVLPGPLGLFLWAILAIGTGIALMRSLTHKKTVGARLWQGLGLALLLYGLLLIIGAGLGNQSPFAPLSQHRSSFRPINTPEDLQRAFRQAARNHQPIVLDFYADWCIACKELDAFVFSQAEVQEQLAHFIRLRADITQNNANNKALQHRYSVIAPPTLLFFTPQGKTLPRYRRVGKVHTRKLIEDLKEILQAVRQNHKP